MADFEELHWLSVDMDRAVTDGREPRRDVVRIMGASEYIADLKPSISFVQVYQAKRQSRNRERKQDDRYCGTMV